MTTVEDELLFEKVAAHIDGAEDRLTQAIAAAGSSLDVDQLAAKVAAQIGATTPAPASTPNTPAGDVSQLATSIDTMAREVRTLYAEASKRGTAAPPSLPHLGGAVAAGLVVGAVAMWALAPGGSDNSGGWASFIWQNHGPQIQGCYSQAKQVGRTVPCSFNVNP